MLFVHCPSCGPTWYQFGDEAFRETWMRGHRLARSHHFEAKSIDVETTT